MDLVPAPSTVRGELGPLLPRLGGGPYNTAVAAGRLGAPVAFLSRVSTDGFGDALVDRLVDSDVRVDLVQRGPEPTTLAVVGLEPSGSARYGFYTNGTADRLLTDPGPLPADTAAVALGTLSLVLEPGASAYEAVLRRESEAGRLISLDPNIRPALITDPDGYRRRFRSWLPSVGLVKVSDEDGAWLVTTVLPGENAVAPRWLARPETAVAALGRGLRALHDRLPAAACPFSWSAQDRVADARRGAAGGWLDPADWHLEHRPLGVAGALALAADIPPADHLVVCHGDACAPNTLLGADGHWTAHVDLGLLGVADRWADLAVATWSAEWNYGPGWAPALLNAYGIAPDPERTRYYRLLWDLSS